MGDKPQSTLHQYDNTVWHITWEGMVAFARAIGRIPRAIARAVRSRG